MLARMIKESTSPDPPSMRLSNNELAGWILLGLAAGGLLLRFSRKEASQPVEAELEAAFGDSPHLPEDIIAAIRKRVS